MTIEWSGASARLLETTTVTTVFFILLFPILISPPPLPAPIPPSVPPLPLPHISLTSDAAAHRVIVAAASHAPDALAPDAHAL